MRERTVLAANALPGDQLVSATLGGEWGGVEILGVRQFGSDVELVLAGRSQPATFCAFECLTIRRAESVGTPAERAAWKVDAELAEVAS